MMQFWCMITSTIPRPSCSGVRTRRSLSILTASFLGCNYCFSVLFLLFPSFHSFFFLSRLFHSEAWADFLKEQNLDEAKLLKSYQIVPRVASAPTFRKGIYAGGGELGAIQALTLLENYLVGRLAAPTFATTTVKA